VGPSCTGGASAGEAHPAAGPASWLCFPYSHRHALRLRWAVHLFQHDVTPLHRQRASCLQGPKPPEPSLTEVLTAKVGPPVWSATWGARQGSWQQLLLTAPTQVPHHPFHSTLKFENLAGGPCVNTSRHASSGAVCCLAPTIGAPPRLPRCPARCLAAGLLPAVLHRGRHQDCRGRHAGETFVGRRG